jgi:hypothetical protein
MPRHVTRKTPFTDEERRQATTDGRPQVSLFVFSLVFFVGVFGYPPGLLGGWLGGLAGYPTVGQYVGWTIGLWLVVHLGVSFVRFDADTRRRVRADVERGEVDELEVRGARVVRIEAGNDSVNPTLVFDIGGGQLLLMLGQWLRSSPSVFGAAEDAGVSEDAPWLNELPPPYAFPSADFTVRRLRSSGNVLSIRVEGEYLQPSEHAGELDPMDYDLLEFSDLVAGTIEDLAGALAPRRRRG